MENLVLQVEGLEGELALLRGSRTFRYAAGLRRLSAGLRRKRVPGGRSAGPDALRRREPEPTDLTAVILVRAARAS